MKILLTAFEPFGDDTRNSAWEALQLIRPEDIPAKLITLQVPTVFYRSIEIVQEKMRSEKPDAVLAIGQAQGRAALALERIAINQDDARIKDNEGNQPVDTTIYDDGQNAYFATLPIKAIVNKIKANGLPAVVSNSAGTFVCNHLMYGILYTFEKYKLNGKGGFLHVPCIPEQVIEKPQTASMSCTDIAKGITLAVQAIIENETAITR